MDMTIVKSLADHLVSVGLTVEELSHHLSMAEIDSPRAAVATAIDKGITLDELCEGFRMAIRIKSQPA